MHQYFLKKIEICQFRELIFYLIFKSFQFPDENSMSTHYVEVYSTEIRSLYKKLYCSLYIFLHGVTIESIDNFVS